MTPFRMTLLIAATAAAALIAAPPADAKSRKQRAAVVPASAKIAHPGARAGSYPIIYTAGKNVGTDPDPNIRYMLMRDVGAVMGGID
jgi:hypothetical protein